MQSSARSRLLQVAGLLLTISFLAVACTNYGKKLKFKKGELYYTKNADEADAQKLGNYLVEQNFFTDKKEITVQLDKHEATNVFRLVVEPAYVDNADYIDLCKTFSGEMSRDVFNNEPVEVQLCDDHLKTKRTIPAATSAPAVE